MPKIPEPDGKLIHPITGEEIPCRIRARMVYSGGKTVYWNIHGVPLDSFIGKLVPEKNKREEDLKKFYADNGWNQPNIHNYLVRQVDPQLQKFPFLLVWTKEQKPNVPVRFVSCWFRGKKYVHIRVREVTGLEYCDLIPQGESTNEK